MDFEQYVRFANEHPLCSVATTTGDQPHVRSFGMWFADTSGFYFSTSKMKDVYRQLSTNPKVVVLRAPENPEAQGPIMDIGTEMRVTGTAEFVDDPALKDRLFNDRPFLRPLADVVKIMHVKDGEVWFWKWENNMRESEITRVRF
ncbi:MAG TPA: pyridoxamine 5'-phosphate oxidase family protein [Candidatus Bathyarchaeia archaeon]|nr:pyridoxamine 5'-phosphate oxidase family protein [Candidatus Bathyarchaeia archaeon]